MGMMPKVVLYNSVSVDGAIKDFDVDIGLHYQLLGKLDADALLVGSDTAKSGIALFNKEVPPEEASDFNKPVIATDDTRLFWVIADSQGKLQGLMHVHRKSGYAKDIIVLVSKTTPQEYLDYLTARHYDFIVAGQDHVDFHLALEQLNSRYGMETVVTDSGGALSGILLDAGLVNEIQLLIAPEIVGKKAVNLFRNVKHNVKLKLTKCFIVDKTHALLTYQCIDKPTAKSNG
jgi:2,5-diamino-6-(ribosylamino)-4(3H)-pyrimidinone 5'-phosphate reductase